MEPVVLDGQNGHFQGQTIPRVDLSYKVSCPLRSKWPILKVKRSPEKTFINTLSIESVGRDSQNVPFSRSNEPQSR
ncbi:hypothetical protein H5410_052974 [Solanum commersonii]|uniref:Uncharacterized protein n=1 Tax=Solanum commersonii TaxID=4109 RepID=A0A9J5X2K0_SOLCO|nr:hypothetical protein H5410_052974 [Solanum commersonii]